MDADTEAKPVFVAHLGPAAHDVLFGPHVDRVPRLIVTVPQVEVVVVVGQRDEVARPDILVEFDQIFGIPLLGPPFVYHILESELGGVAVFLDMEFVLPVPGVIHVSGIPVARLGFALRAPVCPYAELGIAEPFGYLVLRE